MVEIFDERRVVTDSAVATFWVELTHHFNDRSLMVESSVHHDAAFSAVVAWARDQVAKAATPGRTRARINLLLDQQQCLVELAKSHDRLHALLLLEL
ncbi:hypothetical protein OG984_24385 [Nocardioides sp. NBC_00368]|uniref:hypothetical protein n=1 Tax=Nocardioides sp. NBC_00368 TaxID=2976000 RepID=UPI002E1A2092